jgi:autotransporter-associated beta strand protein
VIWSGSAPQRRWRRLAACAAVICHLKTAVAASVDLVPVSTADGTYTRETVAGQPVWRNSGTSSYLYARRPDSFAFTAGQTLYVRASYHDGEGGGRISLHYDEQTNAYQTPVISTRTQRVDTGRFVDAYFELTKVNFQKRQNGSSDFRLVCGAPGGVKLSVQRITLSDTPFDNPDFQLAVTRVWQTRHTGPARDLVDTTSLKGKVMAGYQGWFNAPNDLDDGGWKHWVRNNTMTAPNFTIDAWPDLTEYDPASLFRAGKVMTAGGAPAYLFSPASYAPVSRHFRWMRKHNIDGAFVQRFHPQAGAQPEWVLRHVSQAAAEEGRIWAVEYDVSGMADATVAAKLQADWEWLTTGFDLLNDPRYAREGGKPVVFIWGFPFADRNFTPASATAAVDYFIAQGAYVIGGIPNVWKSLGAAWQTHMEKYHGLLIWQNNSTSDAALIRNRGQDFYPHVWPGFSWAHLKQLPATPPTQYTDRAGGQYYWDKGRDWINGGGADRLFIGMFDEYDEGTQIIPMTDDPPLPHPEWGRFINNQGKPGDWWLMLTDELKRMMWGQRANTGTLPTVASLANRSNIGAEASIDLGATDLTTALTRVSNSGDGGTLVETAGGKECRGNAAPTTTHRYLYFSVNNGFAFQPANGDVTIEVEYYDSFYGSGAGTVLGLQYDGAPGGYTTHPQPVTTTDSDTWRTVRFEIADAWLGGRQNGGADFRLTTSGRKLSVNRVWVRLPEGKAYPFTWTNATAGPALAWSDNANWLGGIVGQSDPTSSVRFLPHETVSGGTVAIINDLVGQQFGAILLGGTAAAAADTTVTLGGNRFSLGGNAPAIVLEAMKSAFNLTYDLAAPVTLLGTAQIGGDGDASFRISGMIDGTAGITKTGASALVLSGPNTYSGTTTITAGTLALGADHSLPDASGIELGSATLDAAAFADTLGALDAAGSAVIQLGPGANLAFANSSAIDWTGGTLTLTGSFVSGSSLRFGTTSGGLTPSQLGRISATGFTRFALDAGGYLTATASNYASWAGSQVPPVTGGPTGDADHDGIGNLLEYALADGQDRGTLTGNTLTFTKRGAPWGTDLSYEIETSTDLAAGSWVTVAKPPVSETPDFISHTPTAPAPVRGFVRLRVTLTAP